MSIKKMLDELEEHCGTVAGMQFWGVPSRELEAIIDCLTRRLIHAGVSRQSVSEFKKYASYCGAEDGGASYDWSENGCAKMREKILQEVKVA